MTATRYTVTQTATGWEATDTTGTIQLHRYATQALAEFAAQVLNALPEGYVLRRVAKPARGMKRGFTWIIEGHGWSAKRDESPALLPEHLIRDVAEHAAGAPARDAKAVIAAAEAVAEQAHRQELADMATVHGPRATPKQVDYIMTLLAARARLGEGGGFMTGPTDRAGVERMAREDASAYINSLKGEY